MAAYHFLMRLLCVTCVVTPKVIKIAADTIGWLNWKRAFRSMFLTHWWASTDLHRSWPKNFAYLEFYWMLVRRRLLAFAPNILMRLQASLLNQGAVKIPLCIWTAPKGELKNNTQQCLSQPTKSERARGCTGLVQLICKENKEQRGKRTFHEGAPTPMIGGFTQWFGSCSLINTLCVWFPASWAPMVAELFFCSLLLECDLLAKKVPGRAPFSQHNIFRNWT